MGKVIAAALLSVALALAQYNPPIGSSGGGSPTGAAGGALAGTYPNPSFAATQSQAITWNGSQIWRAHNAMGATATLDCPIVGIASAIFCVADDMTPGAGQVYVGFSAFVQTAGNADGTLNGFQGGVQVQSTHTLGQGNGLYPIAYHSGTGAVTFLRGEYIDTENFGGGTVATMIGSYSYMANLDGTVTNLYNYYAFVEPLPGGETTTNSFSYYAFDAAGISANAYYSWFDSRGVGRCKEDNTFDAVGQSICAVYNPQFTKYTPGAANHERIVYGQWNGNVAEIGTEKGGTGTLRTLRLIGQQTQINSLKTTGAATGKTVVCVDVATGQLYASTSGVACAN